MILLALTGISLYTLIVILLTLLIIILFFLLFISNIKYNNIISQKNNDIIILKSTIKELDQFNKLLSSIIDKNNLSNDNKVDKKNKEKEFDLDDILIEISKNGISKLDPDKLEYLKKFKK